MASFTSLYSGSSGNSALVQENGHQILIDIGKNCKQTCLALEQAGVSPESLSAILITHEHSDHIGGLRVFLKKYPIPVYSGKATLAYLQENGHIPVGVSMISMGESPVSIDSFSIRAFPVHHDAVGCCGFQIAAQSGGILCYASDLGTVDEVAFRHFEGADVSVIEANYDKAMLMMGPYPFPLKRRIDSENGHLCNDETAAVVAKLFHKGCRKFALCHLSHENNTPFQALNTVKGQLLSEGVTPQELENTLLYTCSRYGPTPAVNF